MPNFRSLTGGYFSADPTEKSLPVTIRMNNPGAINGAPWQRTFPGYVGEVETSVSRVDGKEITNKTTIVETPEHGVAMWWDLMRRYRANNVTTLGGIINRYGGGQNYSKYAETVEKWTGLTRDTVINLYGNDATLLTFAKAMFRYEAGRALPWSDKQILYGFQLARDLISGSPTTAPPAATIPAGAPASLPPAASAAPVKGFWSALGEAFAALFRYFGAKPAPDPTAPAVPAREVGAPLPYLRILRVGVNGADVRAAQARLRELGYTDLVEDGIYADVMYKAVKDFQGRRNLDPDGEIGELTVGELNKATSIAALPPLNAPSEATYSIPPWYKEAEKWIGWKETGVNRGIDEFIRVGKSGSVGDPWCAIFINYCLEKVGVPGSKSAMARGYETADGFVRLERPAVGCIVTMWRTSPKEWTGHVFFYDGENSKGVRGIGANEDDQVKRSFHTRNRITGYWWPKGAPAPAATGAVVVADDGTNAAKREV